MQTINEAITMGTYTISVNERTVRGKALMEYLKALGVLVKKADTTRSKSLLSSKRDVLEGKVEKFASSDELFASLGI